MCDIDTDYINIIIKPVDKSFKQPFYTSACSWRSIDNKHTLCRIRLFYHEIIEVVVLMARLCGSWNWNKLLYSGFA